MEYLLYTNYSKMQYSSVLQESIKCLGIKSQLKKVGLKTAASVS